jgi:Coenzyme PQQ synthesis protein D (PqqD)
MASDYLQSLAIAQSGFVFDPRTGSSFSTNPVSSLILRRLQERTSPLEIVRELVRETGAEERAVRADLDSFLGELANQGWIDEELARVGQ